MRRNIWWRGPEVSVPISDIKRMIKALKFPEQHNAEALDSDDDAPDAIETVLAILEMHVARSEATTEDLFKASSHIVDDTEDGLALFAVRPPRPSGWRHDDAVRETQDPNLPYVGDKPGLVVVPCQNTPKDDLDV